ncbi:MAG: hypoxanthine phosphoribosyltransferase [Thermodesulfobacteriota bacterium]
MTDKELVLSESAIAQRVQELGQMITRDYAGRSLVVVGILKGAFIFMADLVRHIDLPLEIDFVRVASYGAGTTSGELRFTKDIEVAVAGRDVLLVEDIVDTGRTVAFLRDIITCHEPSSLRICALIDKKERRDVPCWVDYVGFDVHEGFLVGYGLDCAEQYRNLAAVYHLRGR